MFRELPDENSKVMETTCSKQIGEGAYGEVFYLSSSDDYVVKCAKTVDRNCGISYSSLREWVVCSQNRHYNLPKAIHIDTRKEVAVFPHYGTTLKTLLKNKVLTRHQKISITQQLLRGVAYAHNSLGIFHRDIKPENVMYNPDSNRCVLIDWGISRSERFDENVSTRMYTLWYRPPEVVMGSKKYTFSADIWAAGILLVELWLGFRVKGDSNIDQLFRYFRLWGTPSVDEWSSMPQLDGWRSNFPKWENTWSSRHDVQELKRQEPLILDIIEKCLVYDPEKRIRTEELCKHPLLSNQVDACIFSYPSLQQRAANLPPLGNIFEKEHEELNWASRKTLFKWMGKVKHKLKWNYKTLFVAYNICDRVVKETTRTMKDHQLLGVTSLLLASKLYEVNSVELDSLSRICKGVYSVADIREEEHFILEIIGMDILDSSPLLFLPLKTKDIVEDIVQFALTKNYLKYTSHCIALAAMFNRSADKDSFDLSNHWTDREKIVECASTMEKVLVPI